MTEHPDPAGLLDELERLKAEYEGCFAEDGWMARDGFEAWDAYDAYKGELWGNRDALLSLARDGLRYRALRERRSNPVYCAVSTEWGPANITGEAVDAAIDAAMKGDG